MFKKIVLFFIIFYFSIASLSLGAQWKELHEKADETSLESALSISKANPDSAGDLYVSGLVYLNLHRDKEAKESFEKIMAIEPELIGAKWGIAEVLRRQHKIDESKELLNQVVKSDPEFWPAYITLAYISYIRMDFNGAVRLANKVLQQGRQKVDLSNHVRAHLLLGGTKGMIAHYGGPLSKVVNGTAVFPHLKSAEKLQPDSAGVKFGIGSFYLLAPVVAGGNMGKAEDYLTKAIEIDPLFVDVHVRLAQLYKAKGDDAKYKEYLSRAQEIDPANELALDVLNGECKFICLDKSS